MTGLIDGVGVTDTSMHFSEWHGREGLDFVFYNAVDDIETKVSLTRDELHCLVVACLSTQYVDIESAKKDSEEIIKESSARRNAEIAMTDDMARPNPFNGLGDLATLSSY